MITDIETPFEDLGHHIQRRWLHDGQVLHLRLNTETVSRDTVDHWVEVIRELMQHWNYEQEYLSVQDLSKAGYSRYAIERLSALNREVPPEMYGRIAIIVAKSPLGHMIRLAARTTQRFIRGRLESQVFTDEAQALAWLAEKIKV